MYALPCSLSVSAGTLKLIGTQYSYFTGKARSYLLLKGIPFEEVLSTRSVFRDVIIPQTGVRFVPVVILPNGQAIQDTTAIFRYLESHSPANLPAFLPPLQSCPRQHLFSLIAELLADEWCE